MRDAWQRSSFGLLTRLFLRQFLENDAISPEADRSQLLAVVINERVGHRLQIAGDHLI